MIERLEKLLKDTTTTLLLVSHDRYFLERICTHIIELYRGNIYHYNGNYSDYLRQKAEREQQEQKHLHQLKQRYKKELAWMKKDPRARASKSRKRQQHFFELHEDYYNKRDLHQQSKQAIELDIEPTRLGNKILKLHNISKSFGEKIIVDNFSYDFKQGERIGIIGKNGVGKSTFIKLLTQQEPIDDGTIKTGTTLNLAHYEQKQQHIPEHKKVIDIIKEKAEYIRLNKNLKLSASQFLERFLFPPAQQHMKAEKLS